jgi:hypothetical protein
VSVEVPARSAALLGLRRPRRSPFVIGSSRHLVQGAIDIAEERWDPRTRVLGGRSVMLDGRAYSLTVAVPPGFRARSCRTSVTCALTASARAARMEFARTRDDLDWEIQF